MRYRVSTPIGIPLSAHHSIVLTDEAEDTEMRKDAENRSRFDRVSGPVALRASWLSMPVLSAARTSRIPNAKCGSRGIEKVIERISTASDEWGPRGYACE